MIRPRTKFNKFLIVGFLRTFNTMNCESQEKGYTFQGFQTAFTWTIFFVSYLHKIAFHGTQYREHLVKAPPRIGLLITRRISA